MREALARVPWRTALAYWVISFLWILFSDRVLILLVTDTERLERLQTYKGWAFVTVTALLLYGMLHTQLSRWMEEAAARKQAQEALRLSEELFAAAFSNNPAAIVLARLKGAITINVNESWLRMSGLSREEVIGKSQSHIWPNQQDRERFLMQLNQQGAVHGWEQELYRKSGEKFIAQISTQRLQMHGEDYLLSTVVDVSQQKKAERALRWSEERFRTLFERMEEGFCVIRLIFTEQMQATDYEFLTVNPAFEKHTGIKNAVGKRMREIAPDLEQYWFDTYGRVALTGEAVHFENAATQFNRVFEVHAFRIGQPEDHQVAVLFTDISERSRAEAAVRRSRVELQNVLNTAATGLVRNSRELRYLAVNTTYAAIVGRPIEQIVGHQLAEVMGDEALGILLPYINRALNGERVEFEAEVPFIISGRQWVHVIYTPDYDTSGSVVGWVGSITDISGRKQAEEKLLAAMAATDKARAEAEAASRSKDHFLAVLSHELRTPLNPVLATASMLYRDPRFDADTRQQLDVICRNAELEARLIDDLLDVTRIERGKVELDRRPVDLREVIRAAINVCSPDIESRQLKFTADLGESEYIVDADAARLQQVFWNLIKNAVKFTPLGGKLDVRCVHENDNTVRIDVTDEGEGIDPVDLQRIFNAFEQAGRTIARQFGGLGLGLTISKAMTELHGGTIEAHSPGKGAGSTFTVRLPLLAQPSLEPATPESPAPTVTAVEKKPLRILVVEDHGDTARVMSRLLATMGHQPEIAPDIASAKQLAVETKFDLMLSDLGLPDGSGLDLMRSLRSENNFLPGIALSGFGQDSDKLQCRQVGFLTHLTKPISLPMLEKTLTDFSTGRLVSNISGESSSSN